MLANAVFPQNLPAVLSSSLLLRTGWKRVKHKSKRKTKQSTLKTSKHSKLEFNWSRVQKLVSLLSRWGCHHESSESSKKTIGWGALAALYRSSTQIQTQHGMSSVSNGWLYPSNGHRQLALLRILRQDAFNLQVWEPKGVACATALLPRKSGALGWMSGNCRSAKIAGSGVLDALDLGQLGAV